MPTPCQPVITVGVCVSFSRPSPILIKTPIFRCCENHAADVLHWPDPQEIGILKSISYDRNIVQVRIGLL